MPKRHVARKSPPNYSSAARRLKLNAGFDAGTTRSKPDLFPATDNPGFSTTVSEPDLAKLVERIALNTVNAPLDTQPAVPYRVQDLHDNPFALNPPYGILPFLTSATPAELLEAADKLAAAKYEFTRQGKYYEAWQASWRERMIERLLQGITTLGIEPAQR